LENNATEAGQEVGKEEKAALLDMLKAMMAFKPGERVTAEQIKKSFSRAQRTQNTKRGFIV
jgi:hypothetical protein